jgi:hypothetical protein
MGALRPSVIYLRAARQPRGLTRKVVGNGGLAHDLVGQAMPKRRCLGLDPPNAHRSGEFVAPAYAIASVRVLVALLSDVPTLLGGGR